jgi:cell division protein FtsX/uncharacterized SAM-binding protein YcdF (DUF218 family)
MIFSHSVGHIWQQNLSGTLTVQIPDSGQRSEKSAIYAVTEILRATPGIISVRPIPDTEIAAMLEPWLGNQVIGLELPMPDMIDVTVNPLAKIDVVGLKTELDQVAPGVAVEDHAVWLYRLHEFSVFAQTISFAVMIIILMSASAIVIFTTRTGLSIHSDIVEVLHLIGAQDSYVARQFQGHALRRSIFGAITGFGLAVIIIWLTKKLWRNIKWRAAAGNTMGPSTMGSARISTRDGNSIGGGHCRHHGTPHTWKNDVRYAKHSGSFWGLRTLLLTLAIVILSWLAGLYLFASLIPESRAVSQEKTDAVVVLTGGARRVNEGLSLLENGMAEKLFISGVYRGVDVQALLKLAKVAPGNLECCIALGYTADSTRGNAAETMEWVKSEGFRSVRLVTANYHMPRSLLEFRGKLSVDVTIVPHPVFPSTFYSGSWWQWRGSARLVISEYHKYILALLETILFVAS